MIRKKKKGFTLIELIAVLVILAILSLIATPLVMNIVKKAKISSNKRSVDAYGKSVELAVAGYLMDYGKYPTSLSGLTVEYSGNEVTCGEMNLNDDGSIYLSKCSVKDTEVLDDSTEDGYYHFGKLSSSSSNPTYTAYSIGDTVTYNGINFYVIEDSDESKSSVTILKAEPLTYEETTTYGSPSTYKTTDGYGGAYYKQDGSSNNYETSDIKKIVDAWAADKLQSNVLVTDSTGLSVRLLTSSEMINKFGYTFNSDPSNYGYRPSSDTPIFLYNSGYEYWTMSPCKDRSSYVWIVSNNGKIYESYIGYGQFGNERGTVRPVITLLKSAI